MARTEITTDRMIQEFGLDPKAVDVIVSDGGTTLKGKCLKCKNPVKIVDINPEGEVEVLGCIGPTDDCLG